MNLLEPDIQKYVFKWEGGELSGIFKFIPEIQSENEEPIGKIELMGGIYSKKFCLCDIDDSIQLCVRSHLGFTGESYEVTDFDNNKIGTVNKKIKIFSTRNILTMKNWKDDEILKVDEGILEFIGREFKINSINGKNVAEFETKQDKVKKDRLRNNYYNTCLLQINDPNFDRKSILGMFICCVLDVLDALHQTG